MPVSSLKFSNLGPFDEIEFEFDPQINVFVGPNNSGKTTALLALASPLIPDFPFPQKLLRKNPTLEVRSEDTQGKSYDTQGVFPFPDGVRGFFSDSIRAGVLGYCSFVPALRLSTDFRSKGPQASERASSSSGVDVESFSLTGEYRILQQDEPQGVASWILDEETIQQIIELDYRSYREKKPSIRNLIGKIGKVTSKITEGFPIRFYGIGEDAKGLFPQFDNLGIDLLDKVTTPFLCWD